MRTSNIKSFSIKGLFGDRDVKIPFDSDIKILVGENGAGKTTILNILYYTLNNKLFKLRDFDFKSIELKFTDGQKISFTKEKLRDIENIDSPIPPGNVIEKLYRSLSPKQVYEFTELFHQEAPRSIIIERLRQIDLPMYHRYPTQYLLNALKLICGFDEKDKGIIRAKEILSKETKDTDILYFPTYRRIEEGLINLGFEDAKNITHNDARLIQFGMRDVKEKLEEIKKEINTLSSRGLSQMSSEILSQLVKGLPPIDQNKISKIDIKDIGIILARVGEAISKEDKKKIIDIVSEKKLKTDDKYLVYFLQKLINIYEQQREIDSSIESFVSVCNEYLKMSKKEIYYEASEVDFYLISKSNRRVLLTSLLSKLSSGEKQIISLFSRIYLSQGNKKFIVLFDEPELSLSIFWQKLLLPHIVASGKCRFILSVTHSPFIFENDLEKYAVGLMEYIKEK